MNFRKQLIRNSSLMVYLSLLLMLGGMFAPSSPRYWLRTAGLAVLAGATMTVVLNKRKHERNMQLCAVRKNKAVN
jgi:hypothetical protein